MTPIHLLESHRLISFLSGNISHGVPDQDLPAHFVPIFVSVMCRWFHIESWHWTYWPMAPLISVEKPQITDVGTGLGMSF